MQHADGEILFSPTDLTHFVACDHLTQLALAAALGEARRPYFENPYADLIRRKGEEHERQFLESLRADGTDVVEVGLPAGDFAAAAEATRAAMQAGAPYVYQAVLVDGRWRGVADFLARVERPSGLGAWSYEVLDTKLARHPRPEHALQLCAYSDAVRAIQGPAPEHAYVVLGTRERVPIRLANVSAYFRRVRRRLELAVAQRPPTLPFPCDHCDVCDFRSVCAERWEREDHLIRVAYIRRDQVERLQAAGLTSMAALADAPAARKVPRLREQTFTGLRAQAALQRRSVRTGTIEWEPRDVEAGRGFTALPPPSPGDLFLDLEGHPFFEPARGLEFLFGVLTLGEDGASHYQPLWAHDRPGEGGALEQLVDLVHARLAAHPGMHVYHFGVYEPSAIKRLMGEHATRELEVDELLRRQVFVDLLTIFRQAIRAGVSSYSLKELEALGDFHRAASVRSGTDAILAYERWRDTADAAQLADIAAYNEEDCRATHALREWLYRQRPATLPWPEPVAPREQTGDEVAAEEERARLRADLVAGAVPGSARWLAGELLEYHRREARPGWWWYYARLGMTPEELVDDSDSIGDLSPDPDQPPRRSARSLVHTLRFPEQNHKLASGQAYDPETRARAGEILDVDDATGTLRLLRGPILASTPLPRALIPGGPYDQAHQQGAVLRVARSVHSGDGVYPALEGLLARDHPRVRGVVPGAPIQTTDLAGMKALALGLDGSHLFVQGPPGSGKTWTGARLIVHLLAEGRRVGISAQSHKAIHNLLAEAERVALAERVVFRGLKKSTRDDPETVHSGRLVTSEPDVHKVVGAGRRIGLLAGTAWLFARPEMDRQLDYLVIDEAGQVSLADALAVGTCARNVILLGDPLQLAQVSQGVHPPGSGASVLEHLLGDEPTIPPDRGLFLERSFRMHPDVCRFISEVVYADRLRSDASAARRTTADGTGIRFLPVDHEGNRAASDEEVARIEAEIGRLLGRMLTDEHGVERPLVPGDIMVVAPYNAQVRRLVAKLPAGVRVGTVDKFQGQEAPVVFFSMATSSGEDVPHNLAFLFSRNRLNVAISRAQCLALLVCSPRLLEARCRSIEDMELVNALCRLVEHAKG